MNKKIFVKRLGISLFWVVAPFVVIGAAIYALFWFISLVGTDTAITLGIVGQVACVIYVFCGQSIVRYWNTWTAWLTAREDQ